MAVIKDLPGIEVTVQVDGVALKEYEDRDEQEPDRTVVRYIEAAQGKEFLVNVEMKKGFRLKENALSCKVYADGNFAHHKYFGTHEAMNGGYAQVLGFQDDRQVVKFRFDKLEIASDGRQVKQEMANIKDLGTITVNVFQSKAAGKMPYEVQGRPRPVGVVSEKTLKGKAVSHSVGQGNVVARELKTVTRLDRVDDIISFTFRYRSTESLKSELIIPRTPTPPPLEERDFDTLTREELKELHRRAKETREQEDNKRKIKRERKDENPRPRKVSRPSAGNTQLELDDEGTFRESSTATLDREEPEIIELD